MKQFYEKLEEIIYPFFGIFYPVESIQFCLNQKFIIMSNTKKKGRKKLVTSLKKAKEGMEILNESRDFILFGVFNVLRRLDEPILGEIFMAYPDLISEHGIEDLFLNKVDFKGATKEEFELASFLGLINSLHIFIFSEFDKGTLIRNGRNKTEDIEEDDIEMIEIEHITDIFNLNDFHERLSDVLSLVVDEVDYAFISSILADESIEESEKELMLNSDPKLKDSKNILLWFGVTRVLHETISFIVDYNSKKERV